MVKRKTRAKRCRLLPQLDNFIRILFCYASNECRVASENVSPFRISGKSEERPQFQDSWKRRKRGCWQKGRVREGACCAGLSLKDNFVIRASARPEMRNLVR